ncbi:MAG: hypothetical protein HPY45_08905 [Anaerolineae bacterium]|nr:hypothetical protein [Anaerolineae bacterium]
MICPHCGKEHAGRARTCPTTGKLIVISAESGSALSEPLQEAERKAGMKPLSRVKPSGVDKPALPMMITCPWCGEQHPARALFCPKTSKALPEPPFSGVSFEASSPLPAETTLEQEAVVDAVLSELIDTLHGQAQSDAPETPDLLAAQDDSIELLPEDDGTETETPLAVAGGEEMQPEGQAAPRLRDEAPFSYPDMDDLATAARIRLNLRSERGFFSQLPPSIARWLIFLMVLVFLLLVAQVWSILRIIELENIVRGNQMLIERFQQILTELMVTVQSLQMSP